MSFRPALLVGLLALAIGAEAPATSSLSMEAVSGKGPLSASVSAPDTATPAPPPPPRSGAVDSSDLKQLPPRVLPFKQQMMFAGGFMIFLAIMLTSMQNLNPND